MKRMIFKPKQVDWEQWIIPKKNQLVEVYQSSFSSGSYVIVGYESCDDCRQHFKKKHFSEPLFSNAITKELADDFIEQDGKRELEIERIFNLNAKF